MRVAVRELSIDGVIEQAQFGLLRDGLNEKGTGVDSLFHQGIDYGLQMTLVCIRI